MRTFNERGIVDISLADEVAGVKNFLEVLVCWLRSNQSGGEGFLTEPASDLRSTSQPCLAYSFLVN